MVHLKRMSTVAAAMEERLRAAFAPDALRVIDDSAKHAGHAGARPGGESHFTVKIIAADFAGMDRVARHRAVYAALQPLFDQGLHALAIDAKAPGE